MKVKLLIATLASCLLIFGCRKDEFFDNTSDPIIPDPTVEIEASVRGIVTDQQGNPLPDVKVINENDIRLTDEFGYFKFSATGLLEQGAPIRFEKDGFFNGLKFTSPSPGNTGFMKVMLVERSFAGNVPGSTGGTVTINGGAQISLPGNMLDASGNVYSGNVSVYAYWYNPQDKNITKEMPGDLRAIGANREAYQLATFGMMAVELESASGDEVSLAEGTSATLEFPLDGDLLQNAPDEIPLWSFNELTGYWEEEGSATLENNRYVGTVSHFSFWNCDAPFPVVKIKGRLIDASGAPIPYAEICISVTTSGLTGYGWTDSEGNFCGKVPKDKTLAIKVKDECGNVIYEEAPFGPYDAMTDLGDISIDRNDYGNKITGRLIACDGQPVSNGYVVLTYTDGYYTILDVSADGKFDGYILNCESTEFTLVGVDLNDLTQSKPLTITSTPGQDISLGDVSACDEDIEEFINYFFKENGVPGNTNTVVNIPFDVKLLDDQLNIFTSQSPNQSSFRLVVEGVTGQGTYSLYSASASGDFNGLFRFVACQDNSGNPLIDPCDGSVEITQIDGVGEFVVGTFNITGLKDLENEVIVDLCGDFRLYLDDVLQTGTLCGQAWNDDLPSDGIRQTGEEPAPGIPIILYDNEERFIDSTLTDAQGLYQFDNVPEGKYFLTAAVNPIRLVEPFQGNDETIDNDFIHGSGTNVALTELLELGGDQKISNIDLGLKPEGTNNLNCIINGPFFLCAGESANMTVDVTGGTGDYSYTWGTQNGNILSTEQTLVINWPDIYQVTVTDTNGDFCISEFLVDFSSAEFLEYSWTVDLCSEGGTITIWNNGNSPFELFLDGMFITQLDFNSYTIDGLAAGTYNLDAIDFNGCQASYSIVIGSRNAYIGDFVWLDNPDGVPNVFDDKDSGLGDVKIRLFEVGELDPIDSTLSAGGSIDSSGWYSFEVDKNGRYFIEVELPDGNFEFVEQGTSLDSSDDSDIDAMTGRSWEFEIAGCNSWRSIDVGIKEK